MNIIKYYLLILFLVLSSNVYSDNTSVEEDLPLIKAMQTDGHILMIRHALAPGFGDPDNIKIGDCSTQRNLNDSGRKQSTNIGKWLKSHKIKPSAIYSSQWCRCMETAELLGLGKVNALPSLNSFFQMQQNREADLRNLTQFIAKQKTDERLIIMVTHSVTISAISGQSVASGDGVLLKMNKSMPYEVIGIVTPEI